MRLKAESHFLFCLALQIRKDKGILAALRRIKIKNAIDTLAFAEDYPLTRG